MQFFLGFLSIASLAIAQIVDQSDYDYYSIVGYAAQTCPGVPQEIKSLVETGAPGQKIIAAVEKCGVVIPTDLRAKIMAGKRSGYAAPSEAQGYGAPSTAQGYGAPSTAQGYGVPSTAQGNAAQTCPGVPQEIKSLVENGAPGHKIIAAVEKCGVVIPADLRAKIMAGKRSGYAAPSVPSGVPQEIKNLVESGAPGPQIIAAVEKYGVQIPSELRQKIMAGRQPGYSAGYISKVPPNIMDLVNKGRGTELIAALKRLGYTIPPNLEADIHRLMP